jgi:hypothetical protein
MQLQWGFDDEPAEQVHAPPTQIPNSETSLQAMGPPGDTGALRVQ